MRPAQAADHGLYLRLFAELGVDDAPADAARWEAEMVPDAQVMEDAEGKPVGYAYTQILNGVGYVRHIVVEPSRRGEGWGGQIMRGVADRFVAAGCARWCLNVKPDNEPAIRLYRACGMQRAYASTSVRLAWSTVEAFAAEGVTCRPLVESDRTPLEERFDLPPGLLGQLAAAPRRVLLTAWRDDARVGLACFDPVFPGCFPFRADDIDVAEALLVACHPHRELDKTHFQVVLEDAPLLVPQLCERGAHRVLSFLHFRGDLPMR